MQLHEELIAKTQSAHETALGDLTPSTLSLLRDELSRLLGIVDVLSEGERKTS